MVCKLGLRDPRSLKSLSWSPTLKFSVSCSDISMKAFFLIRLPLRAQASRGIFVSGVWGLRRSRRAGNRYTRFARGSPTPATTLRVPEVNKAYKNLVIAENSAKAPTVIETCFTSSRLSSDSIVAFRLAKSARTSLLNSANSAFSFANSPRNSANSPRSSANSPRSFAKSVRNESSTRLTSSFVAKLSLSEPSGHRRLLAS